MEIMTADAGTIATLARAEVDIQIETAKRHPRDIKKFINESMQMVTMTEEIAGECFYTLPRDGKPIEGPSARFAEVVASAWGNCRAGARVVAEDGNFITAQGVMHDLEINVAITYEVRRRITSVGGKRYSADMIGVTANAACSIALRNAILKGIPKTFWGGIYDSARTCAAGAGRSEKDLIAKRAAMLKHCKSKGIKEAQVLALLGVQNEEEITLDNIATIKGIFNAVKEGETTLEAAFSGKSDSSPRESPLNEALNAKSSATAPAQGQGQALGQTPEAFSCPDGKGLVSTAYCEDTGCINKEQCSAYLALFGGAQ
jgi:hypothetical protein